MRGLSIWCGIVCLLVGCEGALSGAPPIDGGGEDSGNAADSSGGTLADGGATTDAAGSDVAGPIGNGFTAGATDNDAVAMRLEVESESIDVGSGVRFSVAVRAFDASDTLTRRPLAWRTDDDSIVALSGDDLIGASHGRTQIHAEVDGVQLAVAATVVDGWSSMALGFEHLCGASPDGNVYCWQLNDQGQAGPGNGSYPDRPTRVAGLPRIKVNSLTAGFKYSCAIGDADGKVYCWGNNSEGQAGPVSGNDVTSFTPPVPFRMLAAGSSSTCGLAEDGDVYCWGSNNYGQLGDGSTNDHDAPAKVAGGAKYRWITATGGGGSEPGSCAITSPDTGNCNIESHNVCAIRTDGTLDCWGANHWGQVGIGSQTSIVDTPTSVPGMNDVVDVDFGRWHVCAVQANGDAFCWGREKDAKGGLGLGADLGYQTSPQKVVGGGLYHAICAGQRASCAIDDTDRIACWGGEDFGMLGNGVNGWRQQSPIRNSLEVPAASVATFEKGFCAISVYGVAYCWGYKAKGTIGVADGGGHVLLPSRLQHRI